MADEAPDARATRVVIVDDHTLVAQALASALSLESGIDVAGVVASATEARERVPAIRPDVVIMDFELGDGSGIDVTKDVKQSNPEIAVVMLTSHHDDDVLRAAIDAGCTGFIGKHEPMGQIITAVHAAAAGESVISPVLLSSLLTGITRRPRHDAPVTDLHPRELEILELLAAGVSTNDIASRLFLSVKTVRNYIQTMLIKLDAHSRLEAVAIATRMGIISR